MPAVEVHDYSAAIQISNPMTAQCNWTRHTDPMLLLTAGMCLLHILQTVSNKAMEQDN